ncbi:MAG: 2Fe-2S iron-sulfur cluster-binding protein [Rubrivivax sp.]
MTTITVNLQPATGEPRRIQGRVGKSLMQAAVDAGIEGIAADCGGCLSCATCHVFVDSTWLQRLQPVSEDETAMLEMTAVPRAPESRLSCQIVLQPELDGIAVRLPARQY